MLDKVLHTSALIFVHSLCWKPSHHMHSKMSSVAGLEQVLHKVSLAFLLSFLGDKLANCFIIPACICGVVIKARMEWNGINWGAQYSSFIEQALYFYDFDDIANLFRLLYKKH